MALPPQSSWQSRSSLPPGDPTFGVGAAGRDARGSYMLPIDFCAAFMCIMHSSIFLSPIEVFAIAM
jgi:hypothetical protein